MDASHKPLQEVQDISEMELEPMAMTTQRQPVVANNAIAPEPMTDE